jgi:hypothetical protein
MGKNEVNLKRSEAFMRGYGKSIACAICIVIFLLGTGELWASNLIANPDFETGDLTDWTVVNGGFGHGVSVRNDENDPLAAGSYDAYVSNLNSSAQVGLQQSTPAGSAVPGDDVNYSFDLRLDLSLKGSFFVHIWDINSVGGVIDNGPGVLQPSISADGDWHTFSGSFVAPTGVDHFEIEFDAAIGTGVAAEITRVDNVSLSEVPEPSSFLLTVIASLSPFALLRCKRT